uniref:Quinol monooxygenase YgiN n=2 Tax=unclassified Candidatus Kentrum TaxID=2643149 RepID=A0A451AYR7_9GAMM|nr:MAG: Quinol monooxygenase YgiN [Candidatus Kentron sp. LPFa]VFK26349.1 MAG: Quinol monooxygenase YgiN [Candidatus Kentron sp. LPFa]VFK64410.1 MAG: Quinol monooxygenase YgiN [Candidatus Kentron sp. UNK]VFK71067.1 MAG: Quinol monooxygenase YgiN [Candidatus Kentron sp. UNK]
MSVNVFVELKVKKDRLDEFKVFMEEQISAMVGREGFFSVTFTQSQDDPSMFFLLSAWDTEERCQEHREWRREKGDIDTFKEYLVEDPRRIVCNQIKHTENKGKQSG